MAGAVVLPSAAFAQDSGAQEVEEVLVTGSRRAARSAADAPVPVDVIAGAAFENQAGGDMASLLRNIVPSYNVNAQPINDASTLVRPANLRGMASDQTLVLVNGKRRHRAAVITFLGNGLSDGAQGPDISVIPAIALKQVEVLRDGAAAQYGSDAIAGVINFKLKDASEGGSLIAKYGSTYAGDGDNLQISANYGFALNDEGFLNLSAEWREVDATSRSIQRDDANALEFGQKPFRDPVQIWGAPEIKNDIKLFYNMGFQLTDDAEFYSFGNHSERQVTGGFYFRNPDNRGGIYSNDGGDTRLVGDLDTTDGFDCPGYNGAAALAGDDAAGLAAVMSNAGCYVFTSMFPGGFTPNFGGQLTDNAMVAGVRVEKDSGLTYDISASFGKNRVDFSIINTVNASLGPNSPNEFSPGSYIQTDKNINADFSYPINVDGLASALNFAGGFEYREETFETVAGDEASWQRGPLFDQGFSSASNGFPGFGPDVEGKWSRDNIAFYLDLEADVTDDWIVATAVRLEEFSDFGTTFNYKISTLYKVSDTFKLRGGYNTGFRAPTPGQSNVSNVTTAFENGVLTNRGTIPPTHPLSAAFGGLQLEPEKSTSFSAGFGADFDFGSLTVDFFNISIKDRIAQSSSFLLTAQEAADLEASGIAGASNLRSFRFYTNDFDTRTQGVDIVFTKPLNLTDTGSSNLSVAANYTKTKVTDAGATVGPDRQQLLEEALPRWRGNATFTHMESDMRFLARVNYYGKSFELFAGELPHAAGSEITLDVEIAFNVLENVELAIGAENVMGNYPDRSPWGSILGNKYAEAAPMGISGGVYYARLKATF
jgi:iron complex outermembrane receptor protein